MIFATAALVVFLVFAGMLPPVAGSLAVALVVAGIFWLIRTQLPSILLVFVAVLLVSVVVTHRLPKMRPDRVEAQEGDQLSKKWAASGKFNEKLPIVIHLVFDEMLSVGAMTDDLPTAARTREALLDFGEKHSFRIFDSVYSRYYYTAESIPHMMHREYLGRMGMDSFYTLKLNPRTNAYSVTDNAYFDDMAQRGYRTAVFQSNYIDFCANKNVDLCQTLDSFDPGKNSAGLDTPTRRVSLWQTVLRAYEPSYTSKVGERLVARAYGLKTREAEVIGAGGRYDVHRFPEWFDRFTRFTSNVPRGTHVFAHFLVPHAPYLLLESCVVSGKLENVHELNRLPPAEREKKRQEYYGSYFGQVRCVAKKLDDFMSTLEKSDRFRDAVVVIHGDHGSRISVSDVLEDYSKRDFVDNYAAFFAVRSPAAAAGLDCEFTSLPEVFRRSMKPGAAAAPGTGPHLPVVVLSRNAGNNKVEAPMPAFGCGALQTTAP
ncbi:MAG: sulfatase-like hydrolase/transferase [Thermoanaerobaculia bacterium]